MAEPSDDALLAGVAGGDHDAAVAFVRRHQAKVFGLAVAIVGDHQLAQDVAQEAFVRAWRHAEVFDARRGTAAAWLTTIVRNLAIDALRLRRESPTDVTQLLSALAVHDDAAEGSERQEELIAVRHALAGMAVEKRRAVLMAAFWGLTAREISAAEGIPLGTAKTRVRDGLLQLRATLPRERSG
jgi:RNA polymerase sigma-70 factor (ECF subfamily)